MDFPTPSSAEKGVICNFYLWYPLNQTSVSVYGNVDSFRDSVWNFTISDIDSIYIQFDDLRKMDSLGLELKDGKVASNGKVTKSLEDYKAVFKFLNSDFYNALVVDIYFASGAERLYSSKTRYLVDRLPEGEQRDCEEKRELPL